MTFIVANTIETVIGMGEISDTLDFQHLQSYFWIYLDFSFTSEFSDLYYVPISATGMKMLSTFYKAGVHS